MPREPMRKLINTHKVHPDWTVVRLAKVTGLTRAYIYETEKRLGLNIPRSRAPKGSTINITIRDDRAREWLVAEAERLNVTYENLFLAMLTDCMAEVEA